MSRYDIHAVRARRIWDSRGLPTVEVEVALAGGARGRGVAPAGASCGSREAIDLRDGGAAFGGKGVVRAIERVADDLAPALHGCDAREQEDIDRRIEQCDGTPNFARIGGNAAVATSLAVLNAAAAAVGQPLWHYLAEQHGARPSVPLPEVQIFGGGAHAARRVDVQDFMVMVPGAASFDEAMAVTAEIYRAAGRLMAERGSSAGVADEGGWWPAFDSNEDALDMAMRAIEAAGETPGDRVVLSLDIAATQFRDGGGYRLALEDARLDRDALIDRLGGWLDRYPIVAIEDPLAEDADQGFAAFTQRFGDRVQVVGDDYLVTDAARVRDAAARGACNTALIKVNQAGTVSRAIAAFEAARNAGWGAIVSARSGETEDVSIAHLATGLDAGQLKVGSFARSERMAKWNECLRIEEALGPAAFAGGRALANTWWGRRGSTNDKGDQA
ncbi:MAG TPA: phosphopyruvate hydratase [Sphingomonas sp.]|nr:phosphopyruvate hydratase [Sphingomonas sp.]